MVCHLQRVVKEKPQVDIQFDLGLLCFPGTDLREAVRLNRNLTANTKPYPFSNRTKV
jgi:hypothetical protein